MTRPTGFRRKSPKNPQWNNPPDSIRIPTDMDSYKSNTETVHYDIATVYGKLSNPECFKPLLENENIPADMKAKITEKAEPTRIVMEAQQFPLPFKAVINLAEAGAGETSLEVEFQVELNFMLRSMAAKPLGDGVKKMAQMLAMLPYDRL